MSAFGISARSAALRKEYEVRDLNGIKHILIGALATSMDALAVGASLSLASEPLGPMLWRGLAVTLLTAVSVIVGIYSGHRIGRRFGKWAEGIGGAVLLIIALRLLLP